MSERKDIVNPNFKEESVEKTLRPIGFAEFTGQINIVNNLQISIQAAKKRGECLDHVLLMGPPGLGKTTLSHIIANEMDSTIKVTSGPVLEKPGDLAGILTNLDDNSILFIDEIHRLSNIVEEYLYSAMEDYKLDIMIDSGPAARSVQLSIPQFTLIGATTRAGLLTAPLRSRFGHLFRLDYYSLEELIKVVKRTTQILNINIDNAGAEELASRSRGTPRIANRLVRRARDFAEIKGNGMITKEIATMTLESLEVDNLGLDEMDKRILLNIIDNYNGGPVGLKTISVAVSEEPGTIEEVYEPFLIKEGLIKITSKGRIATDKAFHYFGKQLNSRKSSDLNLF